MFSVTPTQSKDAHEFLSGHECGLEDDELGGKKVGAIGGQLTWCFTQTGLGEILVIKCMCGAEKNLTDFDSW